MIISFKIFEKIVDEPMPGDYVICKKNKNYFNNEELNTFYENNIGVIAFIHDYSNKADKNYQKCYNVIFQIPPNKRYLDPFLRKKDTTIRQQFWPNEVLHWSKNKEDLDVIINSKKFNV